MQFVIVLFSVLIGLLATADEFQPSRQNEFIKTSADDIPSNKIVFFVPGLNFNSSRFDSFERDLHANDVQTYRLFLRYSSYRPGPWESEDLGAIWQQGFVQALEYFAKLCEENSNLEVVLVAYSLGTVVSENVLQSLKSIPSCFKKSIHFAPAYQVNPWLQPILASTKILYSGILIPSFNLEEYQTKNYIYVGEYEGLRNNILQLEKREPKSLNLKHYLVISKNDELVDVDYAVDFTKKIRQDYEYVFVKEEREDIVGKYHLIIDDSSLSAQDYQKVLQLF